jgi:hypothetical protein
MSDQEPPPVGTNNDPSEASHSHGKTQRSLEAPGKSTDGGPGQLDPRLVNYLAAAVVLVALFSVVFFLLTGTNQRANYRLTVVFLFFALSTISVLLFAAKVHIKGVVGGFAITVAGPAALWLVLLVIYQHYFNEDELFAPVDRNPITLERFGGLVDESESHAGWQAYKPWRKTLSSFSALLGEEESFTQRNLVWYALYNNDVPKLKSLRIDTLFFYFHQLDKDHLPSYALKLQRIVGQNNTPPTTLGMSGDVSLPGSSSQTVLLARDADRKSSNITGFVNAASSEAKIALSNLDALIVSYYTNDTPVDGDYIVIDLKRCAAEPYKMASVGVVNFDRHVTDIRMFAMRSRLVGLAGQIPVSFKEFPPGPNQTMSELGKRFDDWPQQLDRAITGKLVHLPDDVLAALKTILPNMLARAEERRDLKQKGIHSFQDLLESGLKERKERVYQVSNDQVDFREALIALVLWGE